MAKPSKPKFGTNAVVPSSKLSASADLADYAANPPACIGARVATQSIPSGAVTSVSLDTLIVDTVGTMFAAGTTVTIADSGIYLVTGSGLFPTVSATGVRLLLLLQNGVEFGGNMSPGDASVVPRVSATQLINAAAGDTVTLQAFQTSGINLNFTGRLSVARVSGT